MIKCGRVNICIYVCSKSLVNNLSFRNCVPINQNMDIVGEFRHVNTNVCTGNDKCTVCNF